MRLIVVRGSQSQIRFGPGFRFRVRVRVRVRIRVRVGENGRFKSEGRRALVSDSVAIQA